MVTNSLADEKERLRWYTIKGTAYLEQTTLRKHSGLFASLGSDDLILVAKTGFQQLSSREEVTV
jgi:hypothetical protein